MGEKKKEVKAKKALGDLSVEELVKNINERIDNKEPVIKIKADLLNNSKISEKNIESAFIIIVQVKHSTF